MSRTSLKKLLQVDYNRFVLQILVALSLPIFILSLSASANLLLLRFLILIIMAILLEIVIFLVRKHKILELSTAFYFAFAFLFLPLDSSFFTSFLMLLFLVALKHIQGGFGKNIFNPGLLSIVFLYAFFPKTFIYAQVSEKILIYLSIIAWVGVFVILSRAKFFAYLPTLAFLVGILIYTSATYVLNLNQSFEPYILKLAFTQGAFLFLGVSLGFSDPSLGFKNNYISVLLGGIAGILASLSAIFIPLNLAFLLSLILVSFWKYATFNFS